MRKFNLQLFGEGGEGSGDGTAAVTGNEMGENTSDATKNRSKVNPLANVQYGKQPTESQDDNGAETEGQKVSFDDLINGDYKDDFNARMQDTVKKRLKGVNKQLSEAQQRNESVEPIIGILSKRYGTNDPGAIMNALLDDDSMYESDAMEAGVDVDTYKEIQRLRLENEAFRVRQQESIREQQARESFARLEAEAEKVKEIYPAFSLQGEMENPKFAKLVASGIDARTAFEVIHRDEIQPATMQYVARKAEEKVANAVKANARRPSENGTGNNAPIVSKTDPTKLTKADREEIRRRVRNGEKISF